MSPSALGDPLKQSVVHHKQTGHKHIKQEYPEYMSQRHRQKPADHRRHFTLQTCQPMTLI